MVKDIFKECNPKTLSPLTLAFIGDGVYDLIVREYLVREANRPVGELNNKKVSFVNSKAQAEAVKLLMPSFTDEELSIYKRGRNATINNIPKNSSPADYHSATGFEALLGFLYLKDKTDRIKELFKIVLNEKHL